jgi:hypothetical protein
MRSSEDCNNCDDREREEPMAGPIYKIYMFRPTEAYYQSSEEEREAVMAKNEEAFTKAGGKDIVTCNSAWSNEQWMVFGVSEYPSVEAVQEHVAAQTELNWFRYVESYTLLGTKWPGS